MQAFLIYHEVDDDGRVLIATSQPDQSDLYDNAETILGVITVNDDNTPKLVSRTQIHKDLDDELEHIKFYLGKIYANGGFDFEFFANTTFTVCTDVYQKYTPEQIDEFIEFVKMYIRDPTPEHIKGCE